MYTFLLYFLFLECPKFFALQVDLEKLMEKYESTKWPLKAGYPGLAIKNLNEYVSFFSHCLVNIQNYQGIDIIGLKSPVYLTRFDVADTTKFNYPSNWRDYDTETRRFLFGKIPSKSERNSSSDYDHIIKYIDKSINARWTCTQYSLIYSSLNLWMLPILFITPNSNKRRAKSLFDIIPQKYLPEAWSKIY